MVILGFAAFLQAAFLPGWIITSWLRINGLWERLLISFALSLLVNHALVAILVILGAYTTLVVWLFVAVEIAVLLVITWRSWRSWLRPLRWPSFNLFNGSGQTAWPFSKKAVVSIFALLAAWAAAVLIMRLASVNPGVFDIWDDFLSFNKWALEWYQGILPLKTQYYPQIIPANWSLIYKLMGTGDIQFFAKALMALFPLGIWLIFIDLYHRLRQPSFLAGASFTVILLLFFVWVFVGSGYVDIPSAFLAAVAFYVLIPDLLNHRFTAKYLLLAAALAGIAALTKQAGIFMIIPVLIWATIILLRSRVKASRVVAWLVGLVIIFSLITLPWYGYKTLEIRRGIDTSEVSSVDAALKRSVGDLGPAATLMAATRRLGSSVVERTIALVSPATRTAMAQGTFQVPSSLSIAIIIVWLLLIAASLFNPIARLALLSVALPYYVIWGIGYSYEFRNMALILPFLGLVAGFGLSVLLKWLLGWMNIKIDIDKAVAHRADEATTSQASVIRIGGFKIPRAGGYATVGIALLVIVGLAQIAYPAQKLQAAHDQYMYDVGMSYVNKPLYEYYHRYGLEGKIRTMYLPIRSLPELKDFAVASSDILTIDRLVRYENDLSVHYVLWWTGTTEPDVIDYINDKIQAGQYRMLFNSNNYYFLNIR